MNTKRFEEMVRFMQGVTREDVYGSSAMKKDVIVEEVVTTNVVADTTTDNDDIILPFNCVPMHIVYGK